MMKNSTKGSRVNLAVLKSFQYCDWMLLTDPALRISHFIVGLCFFTILPRSSQPRDSSNLLWFLLKKPAARALRCRHPMPWIPENFVPNHSASPSWWGTTVHPMPYGWRTTVNRKNRKKDQTGSHIFKKLIMLTLRKKHKPTKSTMLVI